MKKLLILAAVLFLGSYAMADSVLFETNFDDLELGAIVANYPSVWSYCYGAPADENNTVEVVEGGAGGEGRCLRYNTTDKWLSTHAKIPNSENHSLTNDFKVSFKVNFARMGQVNFNSNDGMGEMIFRKDGDYAFKIGSSGTIGFSSTNSCPMDEWIPVSYVMNGTPGNRKLLSVQFGEATYEDLDILISSNQEKDWFPNFRFFNWGNIDVCLDDLKVELVPRNVGDVQLTITGDNRLDFNTDTVTVRLFNEGTQEGEVTISSGAAFMKLNGESSYVKTMAGGSYEDLVVTIDRSAMGNDYYCAKVSAVCGGVEASYPIFIQSGIEGEGYTYYRDHFGELEMGKDIKSVDPAWRNGYGAPATSPIVDLNGEKVLQINYKDYAAFHIKCDTLEGTSESYNYRVSFKGLIPSGCESYNQYNLGSTTDGGVNHEVTMRYSEEAGGVIFANMGNTCPLDEWFDVSYVFNFTPDNARMISITFGDVTSNLNLLIGNANGNKDYFNYMRFFGWCNANSAPIYIKDFVIDSIARPDVGPQLEVGKGGQVLLAEKTATLTVLNAGTGNLSFSAEVTQGGGWLSIREADEETGVLEDTIEGSGSKKYTMDISRDDLGNTYGFGQVTVTGAGAEKTVNFFVQSEDETGATLYYNDFDSMELGNIKNTDPAWIGGAEGTVVVDPITGGSCLEIIGDNQNLHAICKAPEGSSKKFNYTCSMKLKLPTGATGPYFVTGNDLGHYIGEYGISVTDDKKLKVGCSNCDNNPLQGVTAPLGEWVDFAYTYNADPLNCRLLSMTLGEVTVECSEPITGSRGDYDFFNEFRFYIFGNGDHQPIYIDDFRVSMDPKDTSKPGVMDIRCEYNPIPYTLDATTINILNAGGRSFDFTAEVLQGASWLTLSTYEGTVDSSFTMTATANRGKLGYGFHRAIVKFVSSEGETKVFTIGVQAGSAEEGYVLYASDINSLKLSEITDEEVINELSEQDACFDRVTSHNCAAIALDPKDSTQKVIQMINANDWDKYCGYILNVNAPAESAEDYDVVVGMKMLIPETYVDLPEEEYEHPYAAFFVSQDNSHRINELYFYLDQEGGTLNVFPELPDIQNTNWWIENVESSAPVPNNEWFTYYTRFNCKLVDYQYKRFYAFTFGDNEYHMEGSDQILDYPNGISEKALANEEMPTIKFWSYRDNANILLKDITVALVPHNAIPEPAVLGLLALLALAFARKQR
ncbi:BACON domain-containing protein [bacterium]|nr:BACON domain-containing protein [bacterium]